MGFGCGFFVVCVLWGVGGLECGLGYGFNNI